MPTSYELRAAVAAARFRTNESAIMAEALDQANPWTGAELLRLMPERDRASFYKALVNLHARHCLVHVDRHRRKINPEYSEWLKHRGPGKLFAGNTPESLGLLRRLADGATPKKTPRKRKKIARVKPAVEETTRPAADDNGDQPGQRRLSDPSGDDFNKKEPDIWEQAIAKLKASRRNL